MPQTKEKQRPRPQPKPSPLRYDRQANRYRDERGRFLARTSILQARDSIVDRVSKDLRSLTESFNAGKISLAEWQVRFKDTIKAGHTLAAGMAMGGKNNMTSREWGAIGQKLKVQYQALNRFALQIEQGLKPGFGRVEMYAEAVRLTFLNSERMLKPAGQLARWIRTRRESCAGCIEQGSRGVQLASSFPQFGSQQCRTRCGCHLQYVKR